LAVIEKVCGVSSDEETNKDNPFALFFETRSDILHVLYWEWNGSTIIENYFVLFA
jgi:hypothetical protein